MSERATRRSWGGLTPQRLLVTVLFVAIFAMAVRQPADTDTWWHLKSGQLMWEMGKILRTDPFSHTVAGVPWIDHGWLVQVFLWPVYRAVGLGGLALLLAAIVTTSVVLVYRQCSGRPFVAAFIVLLAAVTSSVVWSIRPQIASLLLAALVAYLLHRYKESGQVRWLGPLPLLVILWANCHGGFVVAFILMGCYLVGETLNRVTASFSPAAGSEFKGKEKNLRLWPLVLVILVSLPAVLINPNGARLFPYAFQTIRIGPLQDYIQEWMAPDFHRLQFQPFIWLLLMTVIAMGLSRRRADWADLAVVSVFAYMGLLAARNTALFALVAAPVLCRHLVPVLEELALVSRLSWLGMLTHTLPSRARPRRLVWLNTVLLVGVLIAAGIKVGLELDRMRAPTVWGQGLPLGAVEYLRSHNLPGQMFNSYNWGGYLIWNLYPDKPVFVDGRTDLYALNSRVLDDYTRVHWVRPGWQQVLDRYQIGFVITECTGLLDIMLAGTKEWESVYRDSLAVIYRRSHGTR